MAKKPSVTGRGVFIFPHLTKADTKFKEDGEYHVKLRQTLEAGSKLKAHIDKLMKETLEETKAAEVDLKKRKKIKLADTPYAMDEDEGTITFSFKMKASGKVRKTGEEFTQRPTLYDAKLKPMPADAKIGSGTEGKVSFFAEGFYTALVGAGVTLRLKGAQILKLVEWGASAESLGFKEEDEEDEEGFGTDGGDNDDEDEEEAEGGDDAEDPETGDQADDF